VKAINRAAIVLRPKARFLEFSGSTDVLDCVTVLVPDLQSAEECIAYITTNQRFAYVFKDALGDTGKEESGFPDYNSLDVFLEWFDLEYHGVIYDCADDYLALGQSKYDVYFRDGVPNWYIGSAGLLSEAEWEQLRALDAFPNFEPGYSNQDEEEGK